MRKILILLSVITALSFKLNVNSANAQESIVLDNASMRSEILQMDRKFAIYLPPGYDSSSRRYPVLYLLHGAGDDQTGWVQFGEVQAIADKAIKENLATPMIIVMPDAKSVRQGYFNDINGTYRYEDYFFKELIPYIEKNYRVRAEKEFRAVAGLSMGGGGSFIYALHHPEMFSSACPLSAGIRSTDPEVAAKQEVEKNSNISMEDALKYYQSYQAHWLINNATDAQKKAYSSVRWYIDCGDDDFLYEGNSLIHVEMRRKEIPHEYRVRDGGHTWSYWRSALPTVLEFVSKSFHR